LIASATIGKVAQEFEWRLKDGEEEHVDTVGLTTRKLQPLHVMIKTRNVGTWEN
jgi:ent-kaurene oxidase